MISKDEAQKIASLARMNLQDQEAEALAKDLECILQYIDQLKELKLDDVQPTSHVLPLSNVYREDDIRPSLAQERALSISKNKNKGAFKVPKIIE